MLKGDEIRAPKPNIVVRPDAINADPILRAEIAERLQGIS